MKTVRGGLLLVVGLLALLVFPAACWGAFPGANGRIAFVKSHAATSDIYTIRPDGSGTERLTNDVAPEGQLSWSASGYRLAYVRGHQLFTIGAHGGNPTQLAHEIGGIRYPHYSPNGRRIVFATWVAHESRIVTIRSDGNDRRRVVSGEALDSPSYSPNGKRIVFRGVFRGKQDGIWTIKPDGSGLQRLTRNPDRDLFPEWAPDGRHILFLRCNDPDQWDCVLFPNGGLKLIRADGSHMRKLNVPPGAFWPPIFSPAGDRIAVVYQESQYFDEIFCSDIQTFTPSGSDQGPVTDYCEQYHSSGVRNEATQPAWQPVPAP
jgi:Tol biopolymer transport system component